MDKSVIDYKLYTKILKTYVDWIVDLDWMHFWPHLIKRYYNLQQT